MLASRLREFIGKVVGPCQPTVITSRQILDVALIANKSIDSSLKCNLLGAMCKFDIEKAYDHMSWDVLMPNLDKMRFSSKWWRWVFFCIFIVRLLMARRRASFRMQEYCGKVTFYPFVIYISDGDPQ